MSDGCLLRIDWREKQALLSRTVCGHHERNCRRDGMEPRSLLDSIPVSLRNQVWIQPYLDEHLEALIEKGREESRRRDSSFVSDCLETIHEIGIEYREEFMEGGGESFKLVPNLNDEKHGLTRSFKYLNRNFRAPSGKALCCGA